MGYMRNNNNYTKTMDRKYSFGMVKRKGNFAEGFLFRFRDKLIILASSQ
jgi:hypothetical protein